MSRVALRNMYNNRSYTVMVRSYRMQRSDIQNIVRDTVREIGYTRGKYGFDVDTCAVMVALDKQSADIAMVLIKPFEAKEHTMSEEEIAPSVPGDQGMMFGFANK